MNRSQKPRLKSIDIDDAITLRVLEASPTSPITAKQLSVRVCAALGREPRTADIPYVAKALRRLEADGKVRLVGEQKPADGLGRSSFLWAITTQPDLPPEVAT